MKLTRPALYTTSLKDILRLSPEPEGIWLKLRHLKVAE
jgi:hypothetical protein